MTINSNFYDIQIRLPGIKLFRLSMGNGLENNIILKKKTVIRSAVMIHRKNYLLSSISAPGVSVTDI